MRRVFVLLIAGGAAAAAMPKLEPTSSAEFCGSCHRTIQEAWKTSAHANAMTSRLFQDALDMVESDYGASARRQCLACHSPLGVQLGDFSLKEKVSWEGVTCDYCHSMRSVSFDGPNPRATLDFSLTKSGPLKEVSSPAHGVVFSEVHTTSQVCAPCHEYKNKHGLQVLSTFTEWKESRYAKDDVQCQTCHMGKVSGDVVDPRVQRSGSEVNLHEMPGSHSLAQLNKAVRMRLVMKRTAKQLNISVVLANAGAGHYVPTGSPMRKLILDVRADAYRGADLEQRREYYRTVTDASGQPVEMEHGAFARGATVSNDTRLAPGEERTETFTLPVEQGVPVQVKATLTYYYSPMARSESQEQVVFYNISRLVP